jgi:excisionase family DNA binding protein
MKLMTTEEVAEYLGVSPRTLENWRYRGGGPRWIRIGANGASVRYDAADVQTYLTERTSA